MAQMERNVNLEEIDSDALFGIDALKHQSIFQKILFFVCLGLGILANVCLPMFLGTPRVVCIFIFLGLIVIAVAFGCNYTQDMTYGKYLYYFLFKPSKALRYGSREDIEVVKVKARELEKQEENFLRKEKENNPEAQKKTLFKLVGFILAVVVVILSVFVYMKAVKQESYHHEVVLEEEENE